MQKRANELNWMEGTPGKGIILHDGEMDTWTTREDGNPIHTEYCGIHGIDWENVMVAFDIDPSGGVWSFLKDEIGPEAGNLIHQADPRLDASSAASDQWHLGKTAENEQKLRFSQDEGDILNWDEGNEGKGIIDRNGHVYTWNDDDYEVHQDFLHDHPDVVPMLYFWIEPNGQVRGAGLGDELSEQDEELLRDADPRLFLQPQEESAWSFANVSRLA